MFLVADCLPSFQIIETGTRDVPVDPVTFPVLLLGNKYDLVSTNTIYL